MAFGVFCKAVPRRCRPARTAKDRDRSLCRREAFGPGGDGARPRGNFERAKGGRRVRLNLFAQQIPGKAHHDGARPTGRGGVKCAGDIFTKAACLARLNGPLAQRAEHAFEIHFLPGAPILKVSTDLAREQDHRCGVFKGDMHADGGVCGPGRARDKGDARSSGHAADGVSHHGCAALMSAHRDVQPSVDEGVEYGKIAFARNAKDVLDAVGLELGDERRSCGGRAGFGQGAEAPILFSSVLQASLSVNSSDCYLFIFTRKIFR